MRANTLVDATDLDRWADRREAQHDLPRLVRRLVYATAPPPRRIQFRAGAGVQLGGWDGLVVAEAGNPWVPDGPSGWELSASSDLPGKPNRDYRSRTAKPGDVDPEVSTFVFVSARRWSSKDATGDERGWAAQRREDGPWRDVRAYDADDLEAWLEQVPAVHVWWSSHLGKHPVGARDLGTYWEEWSGATVPSLSPELVLAGRQEVAERIRDWLRDSSSSSLGLRADSEAEALAVFAAVVNSLPKDERTAELARTLVVDDATGWRQLFGIQQPLVLVPRLQEPDALAGALQAGHQVIIPTGRHADIAGDSLDIPRLARHQAREILVEDGFGRREADDLATEARRSLSGFRRARRVTVGTTGPTWATPEFGRDLLPALLGGGWNENNAADRGMLARMTEGTYASFRDRLVRWSREDDPPVRQQGETWLLASKSDAWRQLNRYLTGDDLERFEEVAVEVLRELDPRFDLPPERRWMAGAMGASPEHSGLLRKQLADTVSLLGARGDAVDIGTGVSGRDVAQRVVQRLFEEAGEDWKLWASLSPHYPRLAEAAPDVFASFVNEDLARDEPVLLSLFTDQEHTLFGSSPHTNLLWALEIIAWSEDYLGQSAELLARLAALDPGGELVNRPSNSLREIFLLWKPGTAADVDRRVRVLDRLCDRHPEVAWELLTDLLPRSHDTSHPTSEPRWRDWHATSADNVTRSEYRDALQYIVATLLDQVDEDGDRWADLVEAMPQLPPEELATVVERLSALGGEDLAEQERATVWHACRNLLSQHRSRLEQGGLVPESVEDALERAFSRFEPEGVVYRYRWLFANGPALPRGRVADWEEHDRNVRESRIDAVTVIYATGGMEAVLEFAAEVERPWDIGRALGDVEIDQEVTEILRRHLGATDESRARLALGFAATCFRNRGREWAESIVASTSLDMADDQKTELLLLLPADPRTWDLAVDQNVHPLYWAEVEPRALQRPESRERAASELLEAERPYAAVELAFFDRRRESTLPARLIADILERVVETPPTEDLPSSSFAHHLAELMADLSSSELEGERIAQLEWRLLPLLTSGQYQPRQLHQHLAGHPDFFAELISLAFVAEGEEPDELEDVEAARARNAHELLRSWSSLPGTADDGSVRSEELWEWVTEAHAATKEAGRGAVGLIEIGKALSASPRGDDGVWPHPAVRDVIEEMESDDLDRGFVIGRINSRGVVTRSAHQGGDPERALAEQYSDWAQAVSGRWPRTGRVLRSLSDSYRRDAEREDHQAALREDLE